MRFERFSFCKPTTFSHPQLDSVLIVKSQDLPPLPKARTSLLQQSYTAHPRCFLPRIHLAADTYPPYPWYLHNREKPPFHTISRVPTDIPTSNGHLPFPFQIHQTISETYPHRSASPSSPLQAHTPAPTEVYNPQEPHSPQRLASFPFPSKNTKGSVPKHTARFYIFSSQAPFHISNCFYYM